MPTSRDEDLLARIRTTERLFWGSLEPATKAKRTDEDMERMRLLSRTWADLLKQRDQRSERAAKGA